MRKLVAPLAGLALLFAVGAANAGEAEGEITAYDQETKELTLSNGMKFSLADSVSQDVLKQLKEGAAVKVTYSEQDGRMIATQVSAPGGSD